MKVKEAAAAIALLVLATGAPARADGVIKSGEIEAAKQLIALLTDTAAIERNYVRMKEQFRERMLKANKGRTAEIDQLFDEIVLPELRARFTALMDRRAEITALTMTADQIQANIAFWSSETGRAVMNVPRIENYDDLVVDGMRERLGMIDGLAVRNRVNELGDAVRKHAAAAKAAEAN